jgi:hypothetical protein
MPNVGDAVSVRDSDSWHRSADFSWCSSTATNCGARRPEEQSRPFTVPNSCGFTCHDVDVGTRRVTNVGSVAWAAPASTVKVPDLPTHPTPPSNSLTQTTQHSPPQKRPGLTTLGTSMHGDDTVSLKSYITWRQLIGTLLHHSRILSIVRQRRSIPKGDASVHGGKA